MNEPKKAIPVVHGGANHGSVNQDDYAQRMLLKAMGDGVTDPDELRKLAGLHSAAQLYRTLDRLAIRKEYHAALDRNGLTLDKIVASIMDIGYTSDSDNTRLNAWITLLKSLGVDRYEAVESQGKSWEALLVEAAEKRIGAPKQEAIAVDYEVVVPQMPKDEEERRVKEKQEADEFYGDTDGGKQGAPQGS